MASKSLSPLLPFPRLLLLLLMPLALVKCAQGTCIIGKANLIIIVPAAEVHNFKNVGATL